MNGQNRADVKVGARVKIVLKADQRTGKLTEGVVERLLTKSSFHPHGIKVMLTDGQIGRCGRLLSRSRARLALTDEAGNGILMP